MSTKVLPIDGTHQGVAGSPLAQISRIEDEQEARVVEAREQYEQARRDAERAFVNAQKNETEKMRTRALQQLEEYSSTEPEARLRDSHNETVRQSAVIADRAKKQLPKALSEILHPLLDGSLFQIAP